MKAVNYESKYKDTEQWVKKSGDHFLIGLTDFTQKVFGNILLVDLPEVGTELKTDEKYADLESDKTVSEVFMPMSGTIIEINESLLQQPEKINEHPYESWLIKIEASNLEEYEDLDTAEVYKEGIHLFFNKT